MAPLLRRTILKALHAAAALALALAPPALAAPAASDAPVTTRDAPVATGSATAKPTFDICAGAYAALARDQDNYGADGSLMSERFPNFARINYDERLAKLAEQAERGVSELKADALDRHGDFFRKLVDAETEGDMNVDPVKQVAFTADACDAEFGFTPSLGG
jgi:hypothetical protein